MSKKSKSAAKEKRRQAKRARKAAKAAEYAAYAASGRNTKSKRARLNAKRAQTVKLRSHPHGRCGNPGCTLCFGSPNFAHWLDAEGTPRNMPQRIYIQYKAQQVVA